MPCISLKFALWVGAHPSPRALQTVCQFVAKVTVWNWSSLTLWPLVASSVETGPQDLPDLH